MSEDQHAPDRGDRDPRPTDEDLLAAAREGDRRAFGQLIERHGPALFRLAFRLVGDSAEAEDVVQETLVGAFEHMAKFRGRASVKTWLSRILVRQAARSHRRRARRKVHVLPTDELTNARPSSEDADRRMDVSRALDALPRAQREVVVLREFEGMSYAEIAEVVGVPRGTVESRLHRARQELGRRLQGYLA
jgi:RNA polymerase sigma-70 factor (ECF subfamily)